MNTVTQIKSAIKKSAQQMAREPLELLKNARVQVTGEQVMDENRPSNDQVQTPRDEVKDETKYKELKNEQDGRHLQALEAELKDIRRQKIFNDLMQRIQNGEEVPLEEFTELSFEQKDVLKAQIEAVRTRNSQLITEKQLIEPTPHKGRQMQGQRQSAQKQTTRVEKPVPPSG